VNSSSMNNTRKLSLVEDWGSLTVTFDLYLQSQESCFYDPYTCEKVTWLNVDALIQAGDGSGTVVLIETGGFCFRIYGLCSVLLTSHVT